MRKFNITAACNPNIHYMVDLSSRLSDIKDMIDDGQYFVISRARQYGKTTMLNAVTGFYRRKSQRVIYQKRAL